MIDKFHKKVQTCSVEILIAPKGRNFITSDNPSTLWKDEEDFFIPLTHRFLYEKDPDLELIMPLSPQYLLKVYLNKNRPEDKIIWEPNSRTITEKELEEFNNKIFISKNKKCLLY